VQTALLRGGGINTDFHSQWNFIFQRMSVSSS